MEDVNGPDVVTDTIPEVLEAVISDSDKKPDSLIPETEAEDENTKEQEENKKEEIEKSHEELIPEVQVTPSVAPADVAVKEEPKKPEKEEESDFRVRKLTDTENFLQTKVEPDITSQVSQLTVTTEYGAAGARTKPGHADQRSEDSVNTSISGDFTVDTRAAISPRVSVETYRSQPEQDESEESQPEQAEAEAPAVLDREPFYQMHATLSLEIPALKIRNNFLQRKMAEYFRKRKLEHVLKETDQRVDTQPKYCQRLNALHDLLQLDQGHRLVINAELDDLRKERDENLQFVKKTMKELFDREKDIGTGLIHTKTGKEIPEKVTEHLLKRQWFVVEQVAQHRLKYIKIRNRVTEKQKAMQAVDRLGPNLRLVDYQQLKIENRGFADKVEERDEELAKLRMKCDSIFQVLAHLREKSASATVDIIKEHEALHAVGIEFIEARERKNYFKVERDRYRNLTNRLREETGILLRPRMLQDMEYAVNEVKTTAKTLQKINEKKERQQTQLRAIRKNIEIAINCKITQERERLSPVVSRASGLHKGKPSLWEVWRAE